MTDDSSFYLYFYFSFSRPLALSFFFVSSLCCRFWCNCFEHSFTASLFRLELTFLLFIRIPIRFVLLFFILSVLFAQFCFCFCIAPSVVLVIFPFMSYSLLSRATRHTSTQMEKARTWDWSSYEQHSHTEEKKRTTNRARFEWTFNVSIWLFSLFFDVTLLFPCFLWLLSLSHRCRDALRMHTSTVTVVIQSLHKTTNRSFHEFEFRSVSDCRPDTIEATVRMKSVHYTAGKCWSTSHQRCCATIERNIPPLQFKHGRSRALRRWCGRLLCPLASCLRNASDSPDGWVTQRTTHGTLTRPTSECMLFSNWWVFSHRLPFTVLFRWIVSVYFRNLQFLLWQTENTHFISIENAIGLDSAHREAYRCESTIGCNIEKCVTNLLSFLSNIIFYKRLNPRFCILWRHFVEVSEWLTGDS